VRKVAGGGSFVTPATAEALVAAMGAGASPSGAKGEAALSHREYQVYRLLSTGHTVGEIGAQLKLAPNTVSTYRARILEKTGAKNDVALALFAQRQAQPAHGQSLDPAL
jgi:DNA-binding NarL/FixJ family response regulator